jgi:uncharacterized protein with NAD-binding domain and iron-sulfur cluster
VDLEHRTAQEWLTSLGQSESIQKTIWHPLAEWLTGNDLHGVSADALVTSLAPFFLQGSSHNRILTAQQSPRTFFVEPIVDLLTRQNVLISLNTQAVQFQYEQDRVTGLRARDGSLLHADWYVSAVPHDQLTPLLPERWLSRFAYFQQLSELTTVSRVVVHLVAHQPLKAPRLILMSNRPFQRLQARPEGEAQSLFSLVMTETREHTDDVVEQAASLLCSLELLHGSGAITAGRASKISNVSLSPGTKILRPIQKTPIDNLLVAGSWTDTGSPANLESAIASGERCAQIICGPARLAY